jgi:FHS family L-fucose permease-like MFS transporter
MNRNLFIVIFIFVIFFICSFLTNILGPIIPDIINSFNLSLTMTALLPFSFFIAYGVMSIPSGMLVEKYHAKKVMSIAFMLAFTGSILFSVFTYYLTALFSLFLIGTGMAMLQVAINPMLRVAGGEENFAFNSVLAQLIFGSASFISPQVYSLMVHKLKNPDAGSHSLLMVLRNLIPANMEWVSLYWLFSLISLLMLIIILLLRLPKVEMKEEERVGILQTHVALFRKKIVLLYFLGIFCYVGSEQGISNWISKFLLDFHGLDPQIIGARTVAYFWGSMTLGCLLGLLLLKLFDSRKILIVFSSLAMFTLIFALFGSAQVAIYAFPLIGFFYSVLWSIIFSLALNSLEYHHGSFSGILCTGIIGGAVVPLIIGWIGDLVNLKIGLLFLFLTLGFIFSIGFWANPLITNKTISKS